MKILALGIVIDMFVPQFRSCFPLKSTRIEQDPAQRRHLETIRARKSADIGIGN